MEEVKIYHPENEQVKTHETFLKTYLKKQTEEEQRLTQKYPWFGVFMNWFVVLFVIIALTVYGVQVVHTRRAEKDAMIAAAAVAQYQAEQDAIELAYQQELAAQQQGRDAIRKANAQKMAQLFYGVRNFEKKYGYDKDDLYTLARCVFNRVENPNYPSTIEGVIEQENQWIGYSDSNPMLGNYYQIAYKALEEWELEETKPVGTDFVWAEFDENGIWLKNEYDTSGLSPAQLKSTYWSYGS